MLTSAPVLALLCCNGLTTPAQTDGAGPASGTGLTSAAGAVAAPSSHADNAGSMGVSDVADATALEAHQQRTSLVDHARWELLDADGDAFADRPRKVTCDPSAAAPETLSGEYAFGVDTGLCSYVTARQLTRDYVAEGEALHVRVWHFALTAPEPAEGHVVVELDGTALLDERVAIPAPGGLMRREIKAPRAFAAGAPILFHVHNHGANSWSLVEVSVGP